ncbi:MAG: hypothetical protein OMM_09253 [Candidatus Magnetoglobus multicellularis str. Araruama]|uniref:Uncharacterized protein n=1 Tax=Candidatus Magnetoglobus multicellularis str. Araruama TaxID=890399 RepID=A0A1V1P4U3_9BACT|nr:MAG: hypothetical protein OMM_09253 [Candidatus Magnetoglobus multicellularis str. Araruama]
MSIRTCVSPEGQFVYGIHYPSYTVDNLRQRDDIQSLGTFSNGAANENHSNFPEANVHIHNADMIYEIPNAFPFKGTTYIQKRWADQKKGKLSDFTLKKKYHFHGQKQLTIGQKTYQFQTT